MSPSLDWLAWLGLASLASAWLVSSAAAITTATTPEQAYETTGVALRAAAQGVLIRLNGIGCICDQAQGVPDDENFCIR